MRKIGFPKSSGIYCIENKRNGKKYVGQAENLARRMRCHLSDLTRNMDSCTYLQNAWNKYGEKNFKWFVVEICETESLSDLEKSYILKFHSHFSEGGYNISWGGEGGMRGLNHTDEAKEKIRLAGLGRKDSDETRKKKSEGRKKFLSKKENHPRFNKHLSDDVREKIGNAQSGENGFWFGKKKDYCSSKYFGVVRYNTAGHIYWAAKVRVDKKDVFIGSYKTELEAAKAYNKYVKKNNLPNPLNKFKRK